jgi:hypothetical protein
MIYNKKYY